MAFVTSYTTDKYTTYKGDSITTSLSTAIWLIDDFTGENAIGNIRVVIKETDIEAIRNLSGYYVFTGLADGQYFIDVVSDLYFFNETKIDTSKIKISDLILKFVNIGPASEATSTEIEDVSRLQEEDIIEFRNLNNEVEQKNILDIDTSINTISWAEGLEHNFNAPGSTILVLKNPIVTIHLKPLPSYPFPNNTNLVKRVT